MSVTPEQRHVVYLFLLHGCLQAHTPSARELERLRDREPYGLKYACVDVPGELTKMVAASEMAKRATLEGIAGFYFEDEHWKLNIPNTYGFLIPYYNGTQTIQGLAIYRFLGDTRRTVLTSRGLPRGSKAVPCREALYV